MGKKRGKAGVVFLMAAVFLLIGLQGWAAERDAYPRRPITYLIPMEPGSSMDSAGRPFCEFWQKELGQPLMIVNKPGAAGTIGIREVHAAKPDGYMIGQANSVHYAKFMGLIPFDHHDFDVIGILTGAIPGVFCGADRPWKTLKEMVAYAKSHPGEVKVATSSRGGYWWLATKGFEKAAGIKLNVLAQPGGGAMAVAQMAGGHVDIGVCGLPEATSQMRAGTVRLLAVFGRQRVSGYEEVPTLIESGVNVEILGINSVITPKGLPRPVYDTIVRTFEIAAKKPAYQKIMADLGATSPGIVGAEAVKYLDDQANTLYTIMKENGLLKSP